jgi:ABC-type multidrug transport system permease subunit
LKLQRFWAVFVARNKEFLRDRSSLAWNVLFPTLIVIGFAFAFSGNRLELYKVGVIGPSTDGSKNAFLATDYIDFIFVTDVASAIVKVERHQLDMLLDPLAKHYWINDDSPQGYLLERVLRGSGIANFRKQTVTGKKIRYVDWVLPGVLAMNMMFSCLYGVGYVLVRYRKNRVLKRLKATPLTALEFLAAQVTSRLWLVMAATTLVFIGTDWFIDFAMFGNFINLFLVFLTGAVSLISLGLMITARINSEELAGGLLNMLSWPMMFLSGVWFSLEGLHPWLQKLALLLPLTHLIDGARAVMIDGSGLTQIAGHLAILMVMSGVFLWVGSLSFRWE